MPTGTFLNGRGPTRGLQWLALSDTGNVLTPVATSDAGGGASLSWVSGTAVDCRIDPVGDNAGAGVIGGRIDERSTHVVTVPSGTSVSSQSRFLISGRGTFEVTAVRDRTAEVTRMFEVIQI